MSIISSKNIGPVRALELGNQVAKKHLERVSEQTHSYNETEIRKVNNKECRLFPRDFELSLEETEQYRALAVFSRCALPGPQSISSHRSFLGPIIVSIKRLFYRIFASQLEKVCRGVEQYQARLLLAQAESTVKIRKLTQ